MELEIIKLVELIKEIIPALQREMGTEWCSSMLTDLNHYQKQLELKRELKYE